MKNELLTYEKCENLWKRKRGPKKMIKQRVALVKEGEEFAVYFTTGYYSRDKRLCAKPVARIGRTDVVTFTGENSGLGLQYFSDKLFHLSVSSKSDKRSTVQLWCQPVFIYEPPHSGWRSYFKYIEGTTPTPFVAGLKYNMRTKQILNPTTEIKRKRVDLKAAKPIRESIAAWEKFAQSYFGLLETWGPAEIERFKLFRVAPVEFPSPEEEPTLDHLYQILAKHTANKNWLKNILNGGYTWSSAEQRLDCAKDAFKAGFKRWKEQLYEQAGAYTWTTVSLDKAA